MCCISFPRWKVGLWDGQTPCGGNSPLSMKWLSICSACRAPINASGTHGKSSEREARSNCDSEMSNLPHNVKVVLWAVYSSCSTLISKLVKNDPVVQSPGPTVLHKHHRLGVFLHTFWDVRDTGLRRAYTISPDHWYQKKWNFIIPFIIPFSQPFHFCNFQGIPEFSNSYFKIISILTNIHSK